MQIKPWKKVGEPKLIAKNHGRSLQVQEFEDPYTHEIKSYSQFKGADFASIVLALTTENRVLVTRQFRHAPGTILLELPGGGPKYQGHLPEYVALEEVAEETAGYRPEIIIPLMGKNESFWLDPAQFITPFYPFLFLHCRKTDDNAHLDKGEYVELIEIPLEEWVEMCFTGKIFDAKSVTVTALALRHLGLKIQKSLP